MNDNRDHKRMFVPFTERILTLSLGLLLSGLAHGLAGDTTGEDCKDSSGGTVSIRSPELMSCVQYPPQMGEHTARPPGGSAMVIAQADTSQASEVSAGEADSGAIAPQQSTELYISDFDMPGTADGEESEAADRDLFILGFSSLHTTDDFDIRTASFSYRNHRREWFWPWQEASTQTLDWGLDVERAEGEISPTEFESVHVRGTLGGYLTPGTYIQAQLGHHDLQTDLGDSDITSHLLTAIFGLNRDFSMQLKTGRDFIYPGGGTPGGITEQLTAVEHTASLRWRPHDRLRVLGQGRYRDYDMENDENTSQQGELSILYGLYPSWPWVWAGVGAQQLRFDRQVDAYWSPEKYTSYGLRFESSFPMGARLSGSATANLDKLDEDGATGTGYYLQGGLQYRVYAQLYARLDVVQSKSIQRTSTWTSDSVIFRLSGPLF